MCASKHEILIMHLLTELKYHVHEDRYQNNPRLRLGRKWETQQHGGQQKALLILAAITADQSVFAVIACLRVSRGKKPWRNTCEVCDAY